MKAIEIAGCVVGGGIIRIIAAFRECSASICEGSVARRRETCLVETLLLQSIHNLRTNVIEQDVSFPALMYNAIANARSLRPDFTP